MKKQNVIEYYDYLAEMGDDPVHDTPQLCEYMNKWDGETFTSMLNLGIKNKVLEIGVGSGRLAVKYAPLCHSFTGIDISPKTIQLAEKNLAHFDNVKLVCCDFFDYKTDEKYDLIYSSLTFMHIEDKYRAMSKIYSMLADNGRFVLSLDKSTSEYLDAGNGPLKIFPDTKEQTEELCSKIGFGIKECKEIEFAYIFVLSK